jgi:hypothetical protein
VKGRIRGYALADYSRALAARRFADLAVQPGLGILSKRRFRSLASDLAAALDLRARAVGLVLIAIDIVVSVYS